jgi:hypothetical protein
MAPITQLIPPRTGKQHRPRGTGMRMLTVATFIATSDSNTGGRAALVSGVLKAGVEIPQTWTAP